MAGAVLLAAPSGLDALRRAFARAGIGGAIVIGFIIIALIGPFLSAHDPYAVNVHERLSAPSHAHVLGVDHLGRDVLARVLAGAQIALLVSVLAIFLAALVGVMLGLAAGYGPSWLDRLILIAADALYSFPSVMLALALVAVLGPSLVVVIGVIALGLAPPYVRIIRTATQTVQSSDYVQAARIMGASPLRILRIHLLPNTIGPFLVVASMDAPAAIAMEAGLGFLGIGLSPPAASWGSILQDGFNHIESAPWIALGAGVPLAVVTLGFTFLGERVRDLLDPKAVTP